MSLMHIPAEKILNFHTRRTQCHIDCLNYFASLLGYHFPEHDNDKNHDPIRIGYAYGNYVTYHPGCMMPSAALDAFKAAKAEHHRNAPHHVEHYARMSDIPKIRLAEMICDWHSANFEETRILNNCEYSSVSDFFDRIMAPRDWTPSQREFVRETIELIAATADMSRVQEIWRRLPRM